MLSAVVMVAALSGCGLKRNLKMPDEPKPSAQAQTVQEQPTQATP